MNKHSPNDRQKVARLPIDHQIPKIDSRRKKNNNLPFTKKKKKKRSTDEKNSQKKKKKRVKRQPKEVRLSPYLPSFDLPFDLLIGLGNVTAITCYQRIILVLLNR